VEPQHWSHHNNTRQDFRSTQVTITFRDSQYGQETEMKRKKQCCGSMTFWSGSGSESIRDPDPAIFVIDLQDANKKLFFILFFLLNTF
jgi:hypothetical protein